MYCWKMCQSEPEHTRHCSKGVGNVMLPVWRMDSLYYRPGLHTVNMSVNQTMLCGLEDRQEGNLVEVIRTLSFVTWL